MTKVSQLNNEQIANSDTLHEKPGPLPSKPSLPILAVHCHDDQNKSEERRRREAKETIQDGKDSTSHRDRPTLVTVVEYQASSSQGSSDSQQSPANSTLPIDLGFPIQRNWCSRETLSRNLFQHCPTDHILEKSNFGQPIPI